MAEENQPLSPRGNKQKRASLLEAFPGLDITYREPLASSSSNVMRTMKGMLTNSIRRGFPPTIRSMRGDRPSESE